MRDRDDRFGTRDRDDRFESHDRDGDENRGWFDRVRDSASRWWHGRDDDDEDRRLRDDDRSHLGDSSRPWGRDDDDDDRHTSVGDRLRRSTRDDDERSYRSWQDDSNRGYVRDHDDDNRMRQFTSHRPDDDDRSGGFNRLHDDRGTLGRRGELGRTGRTRYDRYDDRGRFSHFADEDEDRNRYASGRDMARNDRDREFGRSSGGRFDERRREFAKQQRYHDDDDRGQQQHAGYQYGSGDRDRMTMRGSEQTYGRQFGSGDRDQARSRDDRYDREHRGEPPYRGQQVGGTGNRPYGSSQQYLEQDRHQQQYGVHRDDDLRRRARGRDRNR